MYGTKILGNDAGNAITNQSTTNAQMTEAIKKKKSFEQKTHAAKK